MLLDWAFSSITFEDILIRLIIQRIRYLLRGGSRKFGTGGVNNEYNGQTNDILESQLLTFPFILTCMVCIWQLDDMHHHNLVAVFVKMIKVV